MQLAFIHAKTPGSVDSSLNSLVGRLAGEGRQIVGVIQDPSGDGNGHRCEMDLIEIATGKRHSISQNLGAGSKGCRLDPNSIESVAERLAVAIEHGGADILVINRFGKLEAVGRGFCSLISDALSRDIPVLVGVNDLNRCAFEAFADGFATELPDALGPVMHWALPLFRKKRIEESGDVHRSKPRSAELAGMTVHEVGLGAASPISSPSQRN